MKKTIFLAGAMVWAASSLLSPASLGAVQMEGESRSYFQVRESTEGSRFFTLYEYLDTAVSGSGALPLSFHFGGWGRLDLGEERAGGSTAQEFQYGYLLYYGEKSNSLFKLGRFKVNEGVAAAEKIDGLYAGGDFKGGSRWSSSLECPLRSTRAAVPMISPTA